MVVDLWFQENFQENVKKKKPRRNSNLFLLFLLHSLRVPTFTFHLPMRRLQLFLFHTFAGSPDKHSSSSKWLVVGLLHGFAFVFFQSAAAVRGGGDDIE